MKMFTRDQAISQISKHTRLAEAAEREGQADVARRHRRWIECWRDALALLA